MPTENENAAAENESTTQDAPAAPPAKKEPLPLFTKPGESEQEANDAKEAEQEAAGEAEDEAGDDAQDEKPTAASRQEERIGAVRAQIAKERAELTRQAAELQAQMKDLEGTRALKAKLDKFKEDPLLLLGEFGHKFEDVSKRALNAPPTDPRTLELKADLEAQKAELQKIRADVEAREVQKAVAQEIGKIGAQLETEDYEQARAAGWTPERVWQEMEMVFRATGKLPATKDVLDFIEKTEVDRLEKITATKKAKEKLKPAAPPPKKPEPARTLTTSRSAPPAKAPKARSIEQKMADYIAEHGSIFTKDD
jgi:hypothetical protein